ncbi:HAMP domain-containing sensor histidine kinase [Actinoplanes sp. NPDC049548]|uniref:sensor histidine kinase n=1 Tax=Actinoplanes sp. NPDC049548 TaxID=3155152 RepID=UPI003437F27B
MTHRLLLTYLTFALLIVLGLEVPLGLLQQRSEQHQALSQLEHDAEVLAVVVDADLHRHDLPHVDALAQATAQRLGGRVEIVDGLGRMLVTTLPSDGAAEDADIRAVLRGRGRVSSRITGSGTGRMMSVAVTVHPGLVPQGAIRVTVPSTFVDQRVHQVWLILATVGLLALAAAALIAVALARWISRPVRALEQATRSLADDTTTPPPICVTDGPPELRRLAATFAATAERLRDLIASQRSFIGHASHQLKTPLAALRLRLENLEPDIAPAGDKNLRAALVETDRLAQMVEALLVMARCEQTTLPRERIDLRSAVAQRIDFWTPLATRRAVRLTASGPAAHVWTLPTAVDQILDNLLSNALRATPPGGTVAISWLPETGADPTVRIQVSDDGPGLSAEQCRRAMDPFWRAPGSANDGTGLGLPLVRKLAEAGGGHARLQPRTTAGLDAIVVLPGDTEPPTADPTVVSEHLALL